jgi:polysaccharide deacetylase family protein (PEP-CTERM system associated)
MTETPLAHALTIDVEGFAESHAESVHVDPALLEPAANDREIRENLAVVLDLLLAHGCRATFFFLGRIAKSAPDLVRQVAEAGHEVACHSLYHRRITGQTPEEFRMDLAEAKARLEDSCGRSVIGFRAPDFSIGAGNRWALDELVACGFSYDSSVVPTALHDVYGMPGVPHGIFHWPNGLVEFPLPVIRVLGQNIPVGGGGYFRLYPLRVTLSYFQREARRGSPRVFYIHPYEIGPAAPRLRGLPVTRRFRHYVRLRQGRKRFSHVLDAVRFTTMSEILVQAGALPRKAE